MPSYRGSSVLYRASPLGRPLEASIPLDSRICRICASFCSRYPPSLEPVGPHGAHMGPYAPYEALMEAHRPSSGGYTAPLQDDLVALDGLS